MLKVARLIITHDFGAKQIKDCLDFAEFRDRWESWDLLKAIYRLPIRTKVMMGYPVARSEHRWPVENPDGQLGIGIKGIMGSFEGNQGRIALSLVCLGHGDIGVNE